MANTAPRDANQIPALLGTSSSDGTTVTIYANPVTHRLLVDAGSSGGKTFIYNEVVSGSATTFTLANTPAAGLYAVYANGQRLTPGAGNDYTLSGAVITTSQSWSAGAVLADYQY